ncbi:MAG: hypothetical protein NTX89_03465 [Candidatus Omnitrophica bacterium]|nr:hypothetical protein [Candidatus Omnitrophota bacterium]
MPRLLKNIFLISLFLFFCLTFVFAEDITITTYYPSPYGSYQELRSVREAIGLTYSSRATVCWDPPCPVGSTDVSVANPNLLVEGFVGIGTKQPLRRLHVVGDIMGSASDGSSTWSLSHGPAVPVGIPPTNFLKLHRVDSVTGAVLGYEDLTIRRLWAGSPGAAYYDLAEVTPVRKEKDLELGDVVCIDKEAKVRMRRSQKSYDPLVSGIVSDLETAAMVIGGDTTTEEITTIKDKKPIALVGRVLCKVNTENGPIEIGDLLVTSNKPGYAMKADINKLKPGMVLGKAMESLKNGEGKIIVWITLQ